MSFLIERIPPGATLVRPLTFGRQHQGVPIGGPFDEFSATAANRLVGNRPDTTIIESLAGEIEFVIQGHVRLGISGLRSRIWRNDTQIEHLDSSLLEIGDRVRIVTQGLGCRTYVAAQGGVVTSNGSQVVSETEIRSAAPGPTAVSSLKWSFSSLGRVLLARLEPNFKLDFWMAPASDFEVMVGVHSDRRGVRLTTQPSVEHQISMRSEPQCVGAIEWAPGGDWIVIGPDGPTIGGYPRIGWVVRSSIPLLAQSRPGDILRMRFVDADEEFLANRRFDAWQSLL